MRGSRPRGRSRGTGPAGRASAPRGPAGAGDRPRPPRPGRSRPTAPGWRGRRWPSPTSSKLRAADRWVASVASADAPGLRPVGGPGPSEARGAQVGRRLQRRGQAAVEALRRRPRERHGAEGHAVLADERQAGDGLEAGGLDAVGDGGEAGADGVEVAEQHGVVAPEGLEHRPRVVEPAHLDAGAVGRRGPGGSPQGVPVVGEQPDVGRRRPRHVARPVHEPAGDLVGRGRGGGRLGEAGQQPAGDRVAPRPGRSPGPGPGPARTSRPPSPAPPG